MSNDIITNSKKSWLKIVSDRIEFKPAIKTAVAASLSLFCGLLLGRFFDRPDTLISGLWCVLATIVVLQPQLGGTHKAAWIRFSGVAIGSIIGSLFFVYIGAGHIINLGASIFITIIICALLNLKESFRIACLSTAVIIIFGGTNPSLNPWLFSFYRFIDSCIGIIVAMLVAHTLWPESAGEHLRINVIKILNLLSKQFRLITDLRLEHHNDAQAIDEVFAEIQDLSNQNLDYLKESKLELLSNPHPPEEWASIMSQIDIMVESVIALRYVPIDTLTKIFDDSLSQNVTNAIVRIDGGIRDLEKILEEEKTPLHIEDLQIAIENLNIDLLRFRGTRTTRKFNLQDVESFFVFFHRLKIIGEAVIKISSYTDISRLQK